MQAPRPIRIEGDVAYVPLTKGYVAIIDVEDVPLVEGWNWTALVQDGTVYAYRRATRGADGKQAAIRMHRVIMGDPLGLLVDHCDGNGLNNRRRGEAGNLRVATQSQNGMNSRPMRGKRSALKGAAWDAERGKWRSDIMVNGQRKYLGHHATETAAHAAYCNAAAELHGEFRRTK